jgi:hypothetical protein
MSARKTPPSKNHPPAGFRHPVVSEFGQYMRRCVFLERVEKPAYRHKDRPSGVLLKTPQPKVLRGISEPRPDAWNPCLGGVLVGVPTHSRRQLFANASIAASRVAA